MPKIGYTTCQEAICEAICREVQSTSCPVVGRAQKTSMIDLQSWGCRDGLGTTYYPASNEARSWHQTYQTSLKIAISTPIIMTRMDQLSLLWHHGSYLSRRHFFPLGTRLKGTYLMARAFVPLLLEGGEKTIVNMTSITSSYPATWWLGLLDRETCPITPYWIHGHRIPRSRSCSLGDSSRLCSYRTHVDFAAVC